MVTGMMIAILLCSGPEASAQVGYVEQVMVLPVQVPAGHDSLGGRLTEGLRSGVRLSARQRLSTPEEVEQQLGRRSVGRVLSGVSDLVEFSELGGTSFIIGGVVDVTGDGWFEVALMLFSREERSIHAVESGRFADEESLITGIAALARELTHPQNYAPADTAFFYSLILPGLGQLNQGEPIHAAVSAGVVLAALLYRSTTPDPDQYRLDWESYQAVLPWGAVDYRFEISGVEVTEEEFYARLTVDRKRNIRALAQRRSVAKRRKRAGYLIAGAYLFNLIDTLALTRRKVETGPFFIRLETISDGSRPGNDLRMQLRLGIRIR